MLKNKANQTKFNLSCKAGNFDKTMEYLLDDFNVWEPDDNNSFPLRSALLNPRSIDWDVFEWPKKYPNCFKWEKIMFPYPEAFSDSVLSFAQKEKYEEIDFLFSLINLKKCPKFVQNSQSYPWIHTGASTKNVIFIEKLLNWGVDLKETHNGIDVLNYVDKLTRMEFEEFLNESVKNFSKQQSRKQQNYDDYSDKNKTKIEYDVSLKTDKDLIKIKKYLIEHFKRIY